MKQIRISKTKWVDCYNMFYNVYRMTVQIKFEGIDRYFRFSFNFLANDEIEAKYDINKAIAENICYAPENINDNHNFGIFVNKVYDYVDTINDKRK